jgi:hypothetical protein
MTDAELELVDAIVAQLRDGAPLHELAAGADPAIVQLATTIAGELAETGGLHGAAVPAGFGAVWSGVSALGGVGASGGALGAAGAAGGGAAGGGAAGGGAAGGGVAGGAGAAGAAGAAGTAGGAGIAGSTGVLGAIGGFLGSSGGLMAAVVGAAVVAGAIATAVVVGTSSGEDDVVAAEPDVEPDEDATRGDAPDDGGDGDGGDGAEPATEEDTGEEPVLDPTGDPEVTVDEPSLGAIPTLPPVEPEPTPDTPEPEVTDPGTTGPGGEQPAGDPPPTAGPAPGTPGGTVEPPPGPGPGVDPDPDPSPPAARDVEVALAYGRALELRASALATAGEAAVDIGSFAITSPVPTGGTVSVDVSGGVVRYTHDETHVGVDVFGFRICTTQGVCDDGTVTVTTTAPMPVAEDHRERTVLLDDPLTIQLVVVPDVAAPLTAPPLATPPATIVTEPQRGGLGPVSAEGAVTYTPRAAGEDSFTYQVCDVAGRCSSTATVTIDVDVPDGPPPFAGSVRVNFQPATTQLPSGYLADAGEAYGPRSTAGADDLVYGWRDQATGVPVDLSGSGTSPGNARERGVQSDPRLDTLLHMQAAEVPGFDGVAVDAYWELAVPDGTYTVVVAVGDPSFTDSVHTINVEGTPLIEGFVPSGDAGAATRHATAAVTVQVTDGALTIDALGGTNTKLHYVEVRPGAVSVVDGVRLRINAQGQGQLDLRGDVTHDSVTLVSPYDDTLERQGTSATYIYRVTSPPPAPYAVSVDFLRVDGTPVRWNVTVVR